MKLSRYFKQVLSTTKITNGLKDNLKSLELFEAINENEQIKNTDPFTYKIGKNIILMFLTFKKMKYI